jgi:hypothetical protein
VIVDEDGWCTPSPGQSAEDFADEFVASRPPLTDAEIAMLRAIFRPVVEAEQAAEASEAA